MSELIFTEDGILGDHPGRLRIVVNEESGESQLGLLWGTRSRHYDDADTARLAYDAEEMEPLDTAATATLAGSIAANVVEHEDLSTGWTPVLSTDLLGSGGTEALTHTGSYRVWARVHSTAGDDVQLRLLWDVGDLALPVENAPKRIPGASNFYNVDLGEIRLDELPVGDHRWQGVIQGKGDAGGEDFSIDRVYIVPVDEGYGVLRAPLRVEQGLETFVARDEFNQSAAALTGKTLPVGGTWSGAGDADDFAVETTGKTAERSAASDAYPAGRQAVANPAALTDTAVQVDWKTTGSSPAGFRCHGVIARWSSGTTFLLATVQTGTVGSPLQLVVEKRIAGVRTVLLDSSLSALYEADVWNTLALRVDAAGRFFVYGGRPGAALSLLASGHDADLATGGTLASGKPGFYDVQSDTGALARNYDNFAAWVPTTDAVLHPNQSAELRWDGHVREDAAGEAYGPVSHVVGDLPRLPPSGMEERPVEVFLLSSTGDFDQLPDSGDGSLSAQVLYRPSWLFVPSA